MIILAAITGFAVGMAIFFTVIGPAVDKRHTRGYCNCGRPVIKECWRWKDINGAPCPSSADGRHHPERLL